MEGNQFYQSRLLGAIASKPACGAAMAAIVRKGTQGPGQCR
jgi:hypothetical protein